MEHENALEKGNSKPWAIVASFVNPHDIALFGAITRRLPSFNFEIDNSVPHIPPAPTAHENIDTKPKAQASYREVYQKLIQPLADTETYRRLYYSLQLKVDQEIYKVLKVLRETDFYEDTIVIYTSDHGDMLGAHGGLFQKWYVAYEEAIHVPFIIHNPKLIPKSRSVDVLTSHVDILPTILSLANIDMEKAMEELKKDHTEVHPPVGRDLTPLIFDKKMTSFEKEPIYFMTDDYPSRTLNHVNPLGLPIEPVTQPCHLEAVIVKLPTGKNSSLETWKYTRYFDNPQFWSNPGSEDKNEQQKCSVSTSSDTSCNLWVTSVKTAPVPDEIEMYNLTNDPLETKNLANPEFATVETMAVQAILRQVLDSQCKKKRLYPTTGKIPGKPSCKSSDRLFLNL